MVVVSWLVLFLLVEHLSDLELEQSHFAEVDANPLFEGCLWRRLDTLVGNVDVVNQLAKVDVNVFAPRRKVGWPPEAVRQAVVHGEDAPE